MKYVGTLISNILREPNGDGTDKPFSRSLVVDTFNISDTPQEIRRQMREQARKTAKKLELGKEGRDWDFIISEVKYKTEKKGFDDDNKIEEA